MTSPGERNRTPTWWFLVLLLTTTVTFETFRLLFPQMYGFADLHGNEAAAVTALLLFATAFLAPLLSRGLGSAGRTAALFLLALGRIAVLVPKHVPFAVTVAFTVTALVSMTMVLTMPGAVAPHGAALAVLLGVAADVVVRSSFATWDPIWQHNAPAIVIGIGLAGALAIGALRCQDAVAGEPAITSATSGLSLGAILGLELLFLASPAFVASSAGITLAWATFAVLAGISISLLAMSVGERIPQSVRICAAVLLVVIAFLLPRLEGGRTVVAVVAGQVSAGLMLAATATRLPSSRLRAELGLAGGWLLFVLVVLLYQIHFDQPLPFDNRWVVTFAAVVLLVAVAAGPRRPDRNADSLPWRERYVPSLVTIAAAVVVGGGLAMTAPTHAAQPVAGTSLRVVEWNVRQAVSQHGDLAPDRITSVLTRDGAPDVVVIPEAARGWPLSGDLDLASWLSRRLGMQYRWAPAADQQFGTLVLTRLPILSSEVIRLPVAGRSQGRSLLRATLDASGGTHLTLLATHLQARNDPASVAARARETAIVLRQRPSRADRTIVVGDFNPRQGDPPLPARRPGEFPEIRAFLDAGFTTSQELSGCQHPTSGRNCSDFVLVSSDMAMQTQVVSDETFDHRPLLSSISLSK